MIDDKKSFASRFASAGSGERPAGPPDLFKGAGVAFRELKRQRLLLELENLPSLPAIVLEIMKTINDPNSSAQDFEQHIRKDQVLAGRMLKLVNSSFFSFARKISSITDAVVILGFNTLKSLVLATTTKPMLERRMQAYGYEEKGLWKHSICCAGGCKFLGLELKLGENAAEELFVAGLLHDIGKLILGPQIEEKEMEFREMVMITKRGHLEAERAIAGFDHAQVGAMVIDKWKLSDDLKEIISSHHDPRLATMNPKTTAVLSLSNYVVNKMAMGLRPHAPMTVELDRASFETLGIPQSDLRGLLERMSEEMKELETMFKAIED